MTPATLRRPARFLPATLVALLSLATVRPLRAAEPSAAPAPSAPPPPQEVEIMMRDGTRLAADLHLPARQGAFPVILGRTPYNKAVSAGFGRDGAARGYAVLIQDTRGRHASAGENLPFHLDVPDGLDTLAWIRRQPWCNGRVGTWGGSAGAITQFQLAAGEPAGLDAQHLVVGAPNLHEVVYTGGVFRKSLVEDWIRVTRFQDDALARWTAHPRYDAYWQARDASRHYAGVHAAGLHLGGYWDIFAQSTLDGFLGYQKQGGPRARGRQRLVMGPWTHGVLQEKAGELVFPGAKRPPGGVHDTWAWFAATLRDEPGALDRLPVVTYYVIGDVADARAPGNTWRTAADWPPVPAQASPFYLHADRSLQCTPPGDVAPLRFPANPTNPVPTVGGPQLTLPAGPMDQRKIEGRDDVLVFTSDPLPGPLEITGRIQARLWVASDGPDTDFFVRLCDVYPDGRSFNLVEGARRARFREGLDREVPLTPGKPVEIGIDCGSTSVIFHRGHRLRVQVTSSSYPAYDPNPNTGAPFRSGGPSRLATNTVFLEAQRPSHLVLPVVTAPPP